MSSPITIPLYGPAISSAHAYYSSRNTHTQPSRPSNLLSAIRAAFRGSEAQTARAIHSSPFTTSSDSYDGSHLSWTDSTVILMTGGVIRRRWNFDREGEPVQWACIGRLLQECAAPVRRENKEDLESSKNTRPTFGPFVRAGENTETEKPEDVVVPAIFIFLRSLGKIFLDNGVEYVISLPFLVKRAWPASPHGVIVQRMFEPNEREEATETGDPVLPTVFSFTSPFNEAVTVGVAEAIGTRKDGGVEVHKTRRMIPPLEQIVYVSHDSAESPFTIVVSVNAEERSFHVWRYIYARPSDAPQRSQHRRYRDKPMSLPSTVPSSPGLPPISSLPGATPQLGATTTMESLMKDMEAAKEPKLARSPPKRPDISRDPSGRRTSLIRNEVSMAFDRDAMLQDRGRMKPAFWLEKVHAQDISEAEAADPGKYSVALFDHRWDGDCTRSLLAICTPAGQLHILSVHEDGRMICSAVVTRPALAVAPILATRTDVWDLLIANSSGVHATVLTHGLHEIPVSFADAGSNDDSMAEDRTYDDPLVGVESYHASDVLLTFKSGRQHRANIDLMCRGRLILDVFHVLSVTLPPNDTFELHRRFIHFWSQKGFATSEDVEFDCFSAAFSDMFGLSTSSSPVTSTPWSSLAETRSHRRMMFDPALKHLSKPPTVPSPRSTTRSRHRSLGQMLYMLHMLGENLRLSVDRYKDLFLLVPLICKIASVVRPEWADYWQRFCPEVISRWVGPADYDMQLLDDDLPAWPGDFSATLFGRIHNPDWKMPIPFNTGLFSDKQGISPPSPFGKIEPLRSLTLVLDLFKCLSDSNVKTSQTRAENAVLYMLEHGMANELYLSRLPLGIAAPLREAMRTCQLAPPPEWPLEAYEAVGRDDVAASARQIPQHRGETGFRPRKDFISPSKPRRRMTDCLNDGKTSSNGEEVEVTGVEFDLDDFTSVRFGQDRRLEDVARMLRSSSIVSVKVPDRPELNEHDQAKEQQNQVLRIIERTLALPYGRALFTFGTIPTPTKEAYAIPKLEFKVRIQPLNMQVEPELGKIPPDSVSWGQFHNGVAAALRISPFTGYVDSAWVEFNKPSELTADHAGLLYGLGLTGHLKHGMMSWNTFNYLTPKHDFTSIGVLLGLSTANVGTGDLQVTKLLAVHLPALLPSGKADLNVSLMTQAAALSGLGLLYLGTRNRRNAEVCLSQMNRKDLMTPDLSNEHREAYTYSAALAFGMIMLGKGTTIPADMVILERLKRLIHGDKKVQLESREPDFDINLTSPAASIALGLMYLRTSRKDAAEILSIPETVMELNRVQPMFLMVRTIAKCLIMWDDIAPTGEWLQMQMPKTVMDAIDARFRHGTQVDDALELAYYYIIAGCCFAVGLKYAGTARQEAYKMIIRYYDLYTRLIYSNISTFDHRIKRSAIRDGLNLIAISLTMVMAGTGEITCFRRLRYAFGMYQQTLYHPSFKFGTHVSTHMALGLLFLGGGRSTLGTSDAAIAAMVTAFFPRVHPTSQDNKSYLQALRHLWVLAVEPRCLVARDVDTKEVVYLPLKIALKNEDTAQLVSPTLIPDLDRIRSIRVDTPRYWPFYLDLESIPEHRKRLIRSQTLYVKRKTAFLSYTEDPRGSRSLFVRSRSSAGEAAMLDFPQLPKSQAKVHPAGDLSEFISSLSNDALFLAFADHFAREDGQTEPELLFQVYCHACLFDSILQGKSQSIQQHLTLFRYRMMSPQSTRYFHLQLQDLRFAVDFYSKVYNRRFSGVSESAGRVPLIRENTVSGVLHALDLRLSSVRKTPESLASLSQYARGESVAGDYADLAWYLLRNAVPVSTLLVILRALAQESCLHCLESPPPSGSQDRDALDRGIREVVHAAGAKVATSFGSGWTVSSLDEIMQIWKDDSS